MECNVYQSVKRSGFGKKRIQDIVFFVLHKEKRKGAVSVHVIGDTRMKTLNTLHRGKQKTTDVLSFATQEGFESLGDDLGDIFISAPQIKRQAKRFGVSYADEFVRMLVHGVLHILGYDHIEKREAQIMFKKQERYISHLV